jgi:Zn-dependent M28 family amino/carboxypeptidase
MLQTVSSRQLRASIDKLVSFGTRNTISSATAEDIKAGRGIGAAREWIRSEFERYSKECGGCLEVREDRFVEGPAPRIPQPTEIVNVYAVLRGTDKPERVYLVTGHYDSRATDVLDFKSPAPGANDDGSGTAVVLEAARVLSKRKFPGTIIFLAVAGEEQGLNGSRHFAKLAKEQGWNIQAVLNDDTVGGDKSPGQKDILRVFAEGVPLASLQGTGDIKTLRSIRGLGQENDSTSRELARYIDAIRVAYFKGVPATSPRAGFKTAMIWRPDRYLRGGDHSAFNEFGFAAVRLTEWRENYDRQHQDPRTENGREYGDLVKYVDFDYLANVARLNVATLGSLASAPAPPANVRLLTKELTNDSTLTWDASPDAGGYEVVWRGTTSPVWQNVKTIPAGITRVTLDVSKDNVIFGVRAVGKAGNRSLVTAPAPER